MVEMYAISVGFSLSIRREGPGDEQPKTSKESLPTSNGSCCRESYLCVVHSSGLSCTGHVWATTDMYAKTMVDEGTALRCCCCSYCAFMLNEGVVKNMLLMYIWQVRVVFSVSFKYVQAYLVLWRKCRCRALMDMYGKCGAG